MTPFWSIKNWSNRTGYGHGDFQIIIIPLKGRALYRNIGKYSDFYPKIF